MQTSIGLVNARLTIKTGSEGPEWDPYAYTEVKHVRHTDGREVILHLGLGDYLLVNGKKVVEQGVLLQEEELFQKLTGWFSWQWQNFINRLRRKCRKCGDKRSQWTQGYPGESFRVCRGCGEVIDLIFDENAIM